MKHQNIELTVGIFFLAGLLSLTWIAMRMGNMGGISQPEYELQARFVSVSGLKEGAFVEAAGVRVGHVADISFDSETYEALITLSIAESVQVQEDSTASIRTSGIIGDKFVKLTPGGAEELLSAGMEITETESSISIEELISKYIFESKD